MEERIFIHTPTIDLGAFLKWAQVAGTGGEAKKLILSGQVMVNGEVETRRGRKLHPGDRVTVEGGRTYIVALGEE